MRRYLWIRKIKSFHYRLVRRFRWLVVVRFVVCGSARMSCVASNPFCIQTLVHAILLERLTISTTGLQFVIVRSSDIWTRLSIIIITVLIFRQGRSETAASTRTICDCRDTFRKHFVRRSADEFGSNEIILRFSFNTSPVVHVRHVRYWSRAVVNSATTIINRNWIGFLLRYCFKISRDTKSSRAFIRLFENRVHFLQTMRSAWRMQIVLVHTSLPCCLLHACDLYSRQSTINVTSRRNVLASWRFPCYVIKRSTCTTVGGLFLMFITYHHASF